MYVCTYVHRMFHTHLHIIINTCIVYSLSKNPIGDSGFSVIMDALIEKPKCSLEKLG